MSQIILPKLAPSQAATETKANASGEILTGTSAGQPFEEFLDAQHGSLASQPQESELPPTQTAAQANKKKDAKAPVTDQSPATASVKTLVPAPTPAPTPDKKIVRAAAPNEQGTPAPEQTNGLPAASIEAASMQATAIANPPAAPSSILTKSENGAAPPPTPLPKAAAMAAPAALSQPAAAAVALPATSSARAAKSSQVAANPPVSPSPAVSVTPATPAVLPAAPLPAPAAAQRGAAVVYAATPAIPKTPSPIISVRAAASPAPSGDRQFTVTIKASSSAPAPVSPPPVTSTATAPSQAPSACALPVATSQAAAVAKPSIAAAPASLVPTPTVANSQAPAVVALQIPATQQPAVAAPTVVTPLEPVVASLPIATSQSPAAAVAPLAISHSQTIAAPAPTTGTAPAATPLKTEPGQSAQPLITAQPQPAADPNIQALPNANLQSVPAESTEAAVVAAVSTSVTFRASGPAPTGGIKKSIAAEIAGPLGTAAIKGGGKTVSSPSTPEEMPSTEEVAPIGTAIAKQEHAMSQTAQFLETETDFRTNGPGVVIAAPAPRMQAPAVAKTIAAPQGSTSQQSSIPAAQAPAFSISNAAILAEKTSPGSSTASASSQNLASTALNHVMEAADKMTSDGTSHVEVQVNLGDGQQLSVRLQMTQGTVHTVFKTTSPELRQAIEQNWSGFRTGASERGLQISTPVFESPGTGGSFNTFGNRNQSGQPDAEFQDADGGRPSMPKGSQETATPTLSSPLAPSTVGSSVQMYA